MVGVLIQCDEPLCVFVEGFHDHGGSPIAGWFIMIIMKNGLNGLKLDDLELSLFQETSMSS